MSKVDEAIEAIRALNKMFHFSNENIAIVEVELYKLRTAMEQIIKIEENFNTGSIGYQCEVHSIVKDALGYNETIIPDGDGVEAEQAVQVSPKCICKPAEFTTVEKHGYSSGTLYGPDPKCPIHQYMYMMQNGIKDPMDFSL